LHRGGCDFRVVGLNELSTTAVHIAIHLPTHLCFSVSRVELIDTVQLAVSIVHNTSSFSLTIFKRVLTSEVMPQFMCEDQPGFLQLRKLVHSCIVATFVTHTTTPGNTNRAITIATAREEV